MTTAPPSRFPGRCGSQRVSAAQPHEVMRHRWQELRRDGHLWVREKPPEGSVRSLAKGWLVLTQWLSSLGALGHCLVCDGLGTGIVRPLCCSCVLREPAEIPTHPWPLPTLQGLWLHTPALPALCPRPACPVPALTCPAYLPRPSPSPLASPPWPRCSDSGQSWFPTM